MENEDKNAKVIEKISKLLAMSNSSNPNEAAIALERAQKLMEEHNLTRSDISLSSITEVKEDVPYMLRDRRLYSLIVNIISRSFGVDPITHIIGKTTKAVTFIGPNERVKTAAYAFTVVARQAAIAKNIFARNNKEQVFNEFTQASPILASIVRQYGSRSEFLNDNPDLKNAITRTVRRNTAAYLHGWLLAIYEKVRNFALSNEEQELIESYTEQHYPGLSHMRRAQSAKYDSTTMAHFKTGVSDGEHGFNIFHGVSSDVQQKSLSKK